MTFDEPEPKSANDNRTRATERRGSRSIIATTRARRCRLPVLTDRKQMPLKGNVERVLPAIRRV